MEVEKIEYNKKDVVETPKEIEVLVVALDMVTAGVAFNNKTKEPSKEMIALTVENQLHNYKHQFYIPHYEKGSIPDGSLLGKFLLKYNDLFVGSKLTLVKSEDGFYDIKLK